MHKTPADAALRAEIETGGAGPEQTSSARPAESDCGAKCREHGNLLPLVLLAYRDESASAAAVATLHEVCRAEICADGVQLLDRARSTRPALVIADASLTGKDGPGVCEAIKSNPATSAISVMLLSEFREPETLVRCWEAGADECVFLPVRPEELTMRVQALLAVSTKQSLTEFRLRRLPAFRRNAAGARETRCANKVDALMAGLAHQSRNALQRIQACLNMLPYRLGDQAKALELVDSIQAAQDDLHHLYEKLRQYTAPLYLRREPLQLDAVVEGAWRSALKVHQECQAELRQHFDGVPTEYVGDGRALEQAFCNLLQNSLTACEAPIEVEVGWNAAQWDDQTGVRATISDNGPGITPEQRARFFEPFFTTDTKRVGLGVPIACRLIEAHGGWIEVGEGTSKGGAQIIVTLPYATGDES